MSDVYDWSARVIDSVCRGGTDFEALITAAVDAVRRAETARLEPGPTDARSVALDALEGWRQAKEGGRSFTLQTSSHREFPDWNVTLYQHGTVVAICNGPLADAVGRALEKAKGSL